VDATDAGVKTYSSVAPDAHAGKDAHVEIPETRYARTVDDVHIAYQVFGEGPDLVVHLPWLSNVDVIWELEDWSTTFRSFATFARVIVFDRRGLGVSDRPSSADAMAIEKGMEDVGAVMDAVGSERAALLGFESGGTVMALFAASFPARVSSLTLFSPLVCYWRSEDFPWGWTRSEGDEWLEHVRSQWGTDAFWRWNASTMGWDISDDDARRYARFSRLAASPRAALAVEEVERQVDIRAVLPQIQVPTLVVGSRGDIERVTWGSAPWVAEQIPGARAEVIDHDEHLPIYPASFRGFEAFLSEVRDSDAVFDRVLATVLFTDIVESTATAVELGDHGWRELVERHHRVVRAQLARFRGVEVDTAGDGFFATFDGPARAVSCAKAIGEAVRPLGIEVRIGVHTGEIEVSDGKAAGLAVHIGARIGSLAAPSEVLVSSTVKDLVAGSGLVFEDAGQHELKGVTDRWQLYRVVNG